MILYTQNQEDIEKINDGDLQFMADQLLKFVTLYRKKVYMEDIKYVHIVNRLEQIAKLMKNRQYECIINDPSLIDYSVDLEWLNDTDIPF